MFSSSQECNNKLNNLTRRIINVKTKHTLDELQNDLQNKYTIHGRTFTQIRGGEFTQPRGGKRNKTKKSKLIFKHKKIL